MIFLYCLSLLYDAFRHASLSEKTENIYYLGDLLLWSRLFVQDKTECTIRKL